MTMYPESIDDIWVNYNEVFTCDNRYCRKGFNEVKIVVEMPGISKEMIKIDAYDIYVEIKSQDPERKYHRKIEIPEDIDLESAKSNYNNGVLEITFKKKKQQKPKSRQINIE